MTPCLPPHLDENAHPIKQANCRQSPIQDEISNEISGKLRLQLTRAEKKRLIKRHTEDDEACRLYLKGRHHWNKWTEEGFYKAIGYFQQAVEKDPSYALAHTGLAEDPSMDALRCNPRFQDLLRLVGLPALAAAILT